MKECTEEGLTIPFFILTSLFTLLSCTWFLWNYEARQFLYRKLSASWVCTFKRRLQKRIVEIRTRPTIAHPNVKTQREERFNRRACQLEDDGGNIHMMKNVQKFKSTIPHRDGGFGKINKPCKLYNDNQKFDTNDLANVDI